MNNSIEIKNRIQAISAEYRETAVAHRRHIHQFPEPSFQEYETQKYICSVLDAKGISYVTYPDSCAVVARIAGNQPGKTIAYRADMDALKLQEEHTLEACPFRSQNDGVMHACGHDGHTAALLTLAEVFNANKDLIRGEVVFIFQNAEETLPGGAHTLCERGVMDGVDEVYGMHLWPSYHTGEIAYAAKEMMASPDMFEVTFRSSGGHGSEPHRARDILLAGCDAITRLQNIVSREVNALDTAVLSVCQVNSGSAFNVIPDKFCFSGTVRTFSTEVQDLIIRRFHEIVEGTASIYHVECEIKYTRGYPPVINDPDIVERSCCSIREYTDLKPVPAIPVMVGEDFSYYMQKARGTFLFVGCGNPEKGIQCSLHSSTYQMDEDALNAALEAFLSVYIGTTKE